MAGRPLGTGSRHESYRDTLLRSGWEATHDGAGKKYQSELGGPVFVGDAETKRPLNQSDTYIEEGTRMNAKVTLTGTLVGAIALYATGYLIFGLTFASFYAANAGSATGVDRGGQLVWAMSVANLAYAALITFVIVNRTGAVSIGGGAKIGAIVGFLLWCTVDFVFYGTTNISNLTLTVVDPLLELIHGGIGGAVIGGVLGKMTGPTRSSE